MKKVPVPPTWAEDLFDLWGGGCALGCGWADDWHHVIYAQRLRWELPVEAQAAALADVRNGMPLCRHRHAAHHNASERILYSELPDSVFEFAQELDARYSTALMFWLERTYPA